MKYQNIKSLLATTSLVFGLNAGSASADVVVTGYGIFADCDAARAFRNGPLVAMLDGAFAGYDADVEARIKATIEDFEQYRANAEAAFAVADAEQKRRIQLTVGKFLALSALNYLTLKGIPADAKTGYTQEQLKAFEVVLESSNALKADVAQAIATGNPPDDILTDQQANIVLGILGKYWGPVGQFLVGAAKASVDSAVHYWDTQPIIDVARDEADTFAVAIERMHARSKGEKIAGINRLKNEIDAACKKPD